jgi:hypothetical protein
MKRCPTIGLLAAAFCASLTLGGPAAAHAQSSAVSPHPLKADFKGIVGGALLGGELGMVIPALAGATDTWVYIVFPLLGAGGGGVGGYFLLEKGSGHPEVAVATLVAGTALLIPALVLTLAETAYSPEEETVSAARARMASLAAAGPGLLRWSPERGVMVAPPGVSVGSLVGADEALRTGAPRSRVVHASLLSGAF